MHVFLCQTVRATQQRRNRRGITSHEALSCCFIFFKDYRRTHTTDVKSSCMTTCVSENTTAILLSEMRGVSIKNSFTQSQRKLLRQAHSDYMTSAVFRAWQRSHRTLYPHATSYTTAKHAPEICSVTTNSTDFTATMKE